MEVQPDFKELLGLFNEHKIEYIIVGAYALAYHGAPRFTGDIDIYVRPTPENATRIVKALASFGFGSLGLKADDFQKPDQVVQLGVPPVGIDLITSITASLGNKRMPARSRASTATSMFTTLAAISTPRTSGPRAEKRI